ncbi:alpha/beta hydrolase [Sphingomonas sp. CROZ-RG-20F-R02-07]|uniref:alpha/beta fold hydrolase n=1 Tax=Sphingomonas sp. CROZ-RG-20F-R02-07 TaxID=2914832 RepID=UPI001F58C3CC|nr:alpha/beta hydrolase [Sphingomonas sp. CROZ-RG-20F-R02-07]
MRETLFLLPGLLCDATIWAHQTRTLAADHDVRVPDFRMLDSIDAMADAVLAQAPERFSVAGHSMGARVALAVIARAPHRVRRLALLDTGVHPPSPTEAERRKALTDLSEQQGMRALADVWLPPMVGEGRLEADPALRAALYAMVERMTPAIHRNHIAALLGRPDAAAGLSAIRCPVLVGVGRDDRWSPPAQHEPIVAAIPGAHFVVFEGSGHMAPMEAPDAVAQALRDWMAIPVSDAGEGETW